MVSRKNFACKQCGTEFTLGDKPYCPKCSSFNFKPAENQQPVERDNNLIPKTEILSVNQSIKKTSKPRGSSQFSTGIIPRIFFVIYIASWYLGFKMLLPILGEFINQLAIAPPLLIVFLPLLIIIFFVPIVLYQSYVK